mmetsp:Transcript_25647/g.67080  ORF Transcript_25647/g.67080 Transcript_25647/m.67080 type:complete len:153 (-) Transcript_25647:335-793(-)
MALPSICGHAQEGPPRVVHVPPHVALSETLGVGGESAVAMDARLAQYLEERVAANATAAVAAMAAVVAMSAAAVAAVAVAAIAEAGVAVAPADAFVETCCQLSWCRRAGLCPRTHQAEGHGPVPRLANLSGAPTAAPTSSKVLALFGKETPR